MVLSSYQQAEGLIDLVLNITPKWNEKSFLNITPKWNVRGMIIGVNDPSAGSPTETLLRLLLPLSDKVYLTFRDMAQDQAQSERFTGPLEIGRSDGRCVQRAGT